MVLIFSSHTQDSFGEPTASQHSAAYNEKFIILSVFPTEHFGNIKRDKYAHLYWCTAVQCTGTVTQSRGKSSKHTRFTSSVRSFHYFSLLFYFLLFSLCHIILLSTTSILVYAPVYRSHFFPKS